MRKLNHIAKTILHPILLLGVKIFDRCRIHLVDENPIKSMSKPLIFVVNHSNGHDFPVAAQVIGKHFYILADFTMKKDPVVNILNRLNGCVYVDRKNPSSKSFSKAKLIGHLQQGHNILLFPEGTWNLHSSKLLLPLNWGVIDISKETEIPIVPIVLLYRGKDVYAKISEPLTPKLDKEIEVLNLEEKMTTLMWDLMLQAGIECRKNIPQHYEDIFVKEQLATYKKFDLEYETSVVRKNNNDYDATSSRLKNLQPTMQNAFLFNKRLK